MKYSFDDLKGRNCVITGGFGILGMALTRGLAEAGVNLAVISRSKDNPARGEAIAKEFGVKCLGISASTLDKAALEAARDEIHEKLGKIDILINCAGVNRRYWLEDFPTKDWDEVMNINVNGAVYCTQLVGKYMLAQGYGKVINLASMNSFVSGKRVGAYVASKGAIAQITKAFANEWGDRGVRVNAIAPGYIRTDMTKALQDDPASYQGILDRIPEGRWGTPDDLVGPVLLLVSDAADYVNGIVMPIDGGYLAR